MSDGGDFLDSDQLVNSYKRQLLEDQQAQKPKAAACISKMRAIKGTASGAVAVFTRTYLLTCEASRYHANVSAGFFNAHVLCIARKVAIVVRGNGMML